MTVTIIQEEEEGGITETTESSYSHVEADTIRTNNFSALQEGKEYELDDAETGNIGAKKPLGLAYTWSRISLG
jgi:hypothetical protein